MIIVDENASKSGKKGVCHINGTPLDIIKNGYQLN